jgi:DNA primase
MKFGGNSTPELPSSFNLGERNHMIPRISSIEAVKAGITMEQVLKQYSLLERFEKHGSDLRGTCPIHNGNDPTQFRIYLRLNIWHCFGECKHGGDVLDFIAISENISRQAAAEKAITWFNLVLDSASSESEMSEHPASV